MKPTKVFVFAGILFIVTGLGCRNTSIKPTMVQERHWVPIFSTEKSFTLTGKWTQERADAGRTQAVNANVGSSLVVTQIIHSNAARLCDLRCCDGRLVAFAQETLAGKKGGLVVVTSATGAVVDWQPMSQSGTIALDHDRIVTSFDDQLICRVIGQSQAQWQVKVDGHIDSIAIVPRESIGPGEQNPPATIVVSTGSGRATCYIGDTGEVLWNYRSATISTAANGSATTATIIAVADDKVFLPVGRNADILSLENGQLLNVIDGDALVTSVSSDGSKAYTQYAGAVQSYCLFGNVATWMYAGEDDIPPRSATTMIGPLSVAEQLVYIDGHSLVSLSRRGKFLWKTRIDDTNDSPRLIAQTNDAAVIVAHGSTVDLYACIDGQRLARRVFAAPVDDVIVIASGIMVSAGGTLYCLQNEAPKGHLTFDVHPCASEIHLALNSVCWQPDGGQEEAPNFTGIPDVTYTRNGVTQTLGEFLPGCGNALRVHVPPPFHDGSITITIHGKREDGTVLTGMQTINLGEY